MSRNAEALAEARKRVRAIRDELRRDVEVCGSDDDLDRSIEKAGQAVDSL